MKSRLKGAISKYKGRLNNVGPELSQVSGSLS